MKNAFFLIIAFLASLISAEEAPCINKTYPLVIGGNDSGRTHIDHIEYHRETDMLAVGGYTSEDDLRGHKQSFSSPILILYQGENKNILWAKTMNVTERMSFGYVAFSQTGKYLIAFTQYDVSVQMLTFESSTGNLIITR
jgi:hypothetical protein